MKSQFTKIIDFVFFVVCVCLRIARNNNFNTLIFSKALNLYCELTVWLAAGIISSLPNNYIPNTQSRASQ